MTMTEFYGFCLVIFSGYIVSITLFFMSLGMINYFLNILDLKFSAYKIHMLFSSVILLGVQIATIIATVQFGFHPLQLVLISFVLGWLTFKRKIEKI